MILRFALFLLVCNFSCIKASPIEHVPKEDQKELEFFFRALLVNSNFGYTLFGDKPFSFESWFQCPEWFHFVQPTNSCVLIRNGLAIWKKYEKQFPSKNFVFLTHTFKDAPKPCEGFFLINKSACLRTIKQHLGLFQEILGTKQSAVEIFDDILQNSFQIEHAGLKGILLGYGKGNAFKFCENEQKNEIPIFIEQKNLSILEEENPLSLLTLPTFLTEPTSMETRNLIRNYQMTREKITEVFYSPNFIEIVLNQFMEKV